MTIVIRYALSAFMVLTALFMTVPAQASIHQTKAHYAEWVKEEARQPINDATAKSIVDAAHEYGKQYGFDPLFLLSIMKVESNFRPKVKNKYGAHGLMQVVPRFHKDKIKGRNILAIKTNVQVGTKILRDCFDRHKQKFAAAISCYNGGASAKYVKKVRIAYKDARRVDVAMRFSKELPIPEFRVLVDGQLPKDVMVASL